MVPVDGVSERELRESILCDFSTSEGRFEILKNVVEKIGPEVVVKASAEEVNADFVKVVEDGAINGGGLCLRPATVGDSVSYQQ